jgi:integration host factor subunit alpha
MTLTKPHLIDAIAEQNGFAEKKSSKTVETILEIIKSTLASGEDVLISGFGKFCVKEKRERRGRNPATVQVLKIIMGRKRGFDAPTIMAETGFNQKKEWNIIHRAYKTGKIERVGKGLYVTA